MLSAFRRFVSTLAALVDQEPFDWFHQLVDGAAAAAPSSDHRWMDFSVERRTPSHHFPRKCHPRSMFARSTVSTIWP